MIKRGLDARGVRDKEGLPEGSRRPDGRDKGGVTEGSRRPEGRDKEGVLGTPPPPYHYSIPSE